MATLEMINKKIVETENKILNYIKKEKFFYFGAIITFLAIFIRIYFIPFKSEDYMIFLEKWFNTLKSSGGLYGLKENIGDYNAPYVTIILLSLVYLIKDKYLKAFIFFGISFAFIVLSKNIKFDTNLIIKTALWSTVICVFFLPHMHDRYIFVADILSVIYFIITRKNICIPIGINFISFSTYVKYLFDVTLFNSQILAVINLIIVIYLTYSVFKDFLKEDDIKT